MNKNFFILLFLIMPLFVVSCQNGSNYKTMTGCAWATTYHITYNSSTDFSDSVLNQIRAIDESLSKFNPESTLSKINAATTEADADAYVNEIWPLIVRIHHQSEGYYDPTVSPLAELWGFGKNKTSAVPDSNKIAEACLVVGLDKWILYDDHKIIKPSSQAQLDLSSIAKGYGVDQIARMLKRNGVNDFMIEIGGEISLSGKNPQGNPWKIQIDSPTAKYPGEKAYKWIDTTNCAIATSGNYRNNYTDTNTGKTISHTLNPHTGYPAPTALLSVTVIAPTCAEADGLATALMASPNDVVKNITEQNKHCKIIAIPAN